MSKTDGKIQQDSEIDVIDAVVIDGADNNTEEAAGQTETNEVGNEVDTSETKEKKKGSFAKKAIPGAIIAGFIIYAFTQTGSVTQKPQQEAAQAQQDAQVNSLGGTAVVGKAQQLAVDPFAEPNNPELAEMAASDALLREKTALEKQAKGAEGASLDGNAGAGKIALDLPPEPKNEPAGDSGSVSTGVKTGQQKQEKAAEVVRVNPKMEAVANFLHVYQSYPQPAYFAPAGRAEQLQAEAEAREAAAQADTPAARDGKTENQQPQGKLVADAGDMKYGESTLTADSRMAGSPVRVVLKGGNLAGAVLLGETVPAGGNRQLFKLNTITLKGKGTYPVSAILVNPNDYDISSISDERSNPSFLKALTALGIKFAGEFGRAKLNNDTQTTITGRAVVTSNGKKTNKELALGALGSGIGGAEAALQGYVDEKLQPYTKVYPGKEVGVLFLSSLYI